MSDTDAAKIQVAKDILAAWERMDWDGTAALFTEDAVLEIATGKPVVGRANIRAALDFLAKGLEFQDLQIKHIGAINGRVYTERTDVVVVDGKRTAFPVVGVLTIEDGLVSHWTEYMDRTMMREHLSGEPTPATATDHSGAADSDEEKVATVRGILDAWTAQDWDRVANLFAEDGVLHSVMTTPVVGRAEFARRLDVLHEGLERIELHIKDLGVIDGRVYVERIDDFDVNGNHCELPVVGVIQVADGQVFEWLEYYDRRSLLKGMGVDPTKDFANH